MPDVLAHFADDGTRVYQLLPWLPVLEILHARHPVAVVVRDPAVAELVRVRTDLPVHLAPSFPQLTALYDALAAKLVLYCNNSPHNFSSLLDGRLLHAHVNHGESDKHSGASNNAKAYDRVLLAGAAAVQRLRDSLMELDETRLVRVGRPQLDVLGPSPLPPSDRRTVLYAPTWEGDADYNNHTSLDVLGPAIVRAALAVPDVRVVYRPHPQVPVSNHPGVREAHRLVLAELADAVRRDPAGGHLALLEGDVARVLTGCAALVADVSSVGLDWLYLCPDRPLFVADRHDDPDRLRAAAPVSRGADVVDRSSVVGLTRLLAARLDHDERRTTRAGLRDHYFDGLAVGQSLHRFLTTVDELVVLRDRLRAALPSPS